MKSLKAVAPLRSRLPFTRIGAVVASITCCIALSACGDKKVKPASQVAAKVNGDEITVHQINFVLQQQRGLKPEQVDEASRTVLERLIDQEIAVQMAVKAKLDRDPRVVQAIEAGRRDALARAYIESQAEGTAKPSAEEINKYYGDKPALFKNRRVYTFQEFVIQAPPQAMATVQSTLLSAKTSQAFADALAAAKLPFNVSTTTHPAENIPLDLLDKVAAMNEGQAMLLPEAGGARALVLTRTVAAPVSLEQARSSIEQFLFNNAKRHKLEADVKALRADSKITYVGKFAEPAASAASAAALAAPVATPITSTPPPTPSNASSVDADAVSKGIKGLK